MKYYTLPWWAGDVEDIQKPMDEYREYLDSIFTQLPESLQKLSKDVSLHDAHLRVFHFEASHKSLKLELEGCGFDQSLEAYFERKFQLSYEDIRFITSVADPEVELPSPHGYGDLGYDEVEIIAPSLYEHRMLFSTGIEIQVQFSKFSFLYEDKR